MAVAITIAEIREDFDLPVSDAALEMAVALMESADKCLDAHKVPEPLQKMLKLAGIRHIAFMQANSGKGAVKSQTAPNGASQSFAGWSGEGGSPYWNVLDQFDQFGCITGLINTGPNVGAWSVGGPSCLL